MREGRVDLFQLAPDSSGRVAEVSESYGRSIILECKNETVMVKVWLVVEEIGEHQVFRHVFEADMMILCKFRAHFGPWATKKHEESPPECHTRDSL